MPIDVFCTCGKTLRIKDELIGRKFKCPACSAVITAKQPGAANVSTAAKAAPKSQPAPSGIQTKQPPPAGATIEIRCGKCQKAFTAPEKYAGKTVKCRCGAVFIAPLPDLTPSPADSLLGLLDGELPNQPGLAEPAQDAAFGAGPLASAGQVGFGPAIADSPASTEAFGLRWFLRRKLAIAVAILTLATIVVLILVLGATSPKPGFAKPSFWLESPLFWALRLSVITALLVAWTLTGIPCSILGFCFPVRKRRGPYGRWLETWARLSAILSGLALFFVSVVVPAVFRMAVNCGMRPSPESLRTLAAVMLFWVPVAIMVCTAIFFLTFCVSIALRLARQFGPVGAVNIALLSFWPAWLVLNACWIPCIWIYLTIFTANAINEPNVPFGGPRW